MVLRKSLNVRGLEQEFDDRPIRVVDLFGRREQRAKELKQVKIWGTPPGIIWNVPVLKVALIPKRGKAKCCRIRTERKRSEINLEEGIKLD